MKLTKEQFVAELEAYTADCDYEGLHYYMEVNPDILANQYPLYEKYLQNGDDSDSAIRHIARVDIAWTYE